MYKLNREKIDSILYSTWFLWGVCFFINLTTFLFLYFKLHPGTKILALHYNVMVGVEWYGKGKNLYFIPGAALLISVVNLILYRALKKSGEILAPLTVFVSICVQIIMLISVLFLSTVN